MRSRRNTALHLGIDANEFRREWMEDHLRHWLRAAPRPNGFFRSAFDRRWHPAAEQYATLVSQARLLYVFAAGWHVTGEPACRDAVGRGSGFLLKHFRDGVHGGWFWSVSPDGSVREDHKQSYGHAFVIWGLAHAYSVTGDDRLLRAIERTWEVLDERLRDEQGGIALRAARDFSDRSGGACQNQMMHLFEALLAVQELTGSPYALRRAERTAEFLFRRLYVERPSRVDAYLAEDGDEAWRPLPRDRGGRVNLGHQFEWAFLLSRAVQIGADPGWIEIGRRLLDFARRAGQTPSGGLHTWCGYDGAPCPGALSWWEQAEKLRALMHYAACRGRDECRPAFERSLAFVRTAFRDPAFGGWYRKVSPDPPHAPVDEDKGEVRKVGYHVTAMYMEALRLAGPQA